MQIQQPARHFGVGQRIGFRIAQLMQAAAPAAIA
jgi:hypothetical protein